MAPRHTACETCGRWTRGRPCPVHPDARQVDVLEEGAAPLGWRADAIRASHLRARSSAAPAVAFAAGVLAPAAVALARADLWGAAAVAIAPVFVSAGVLRASLRALARAPAQVDIRAEDRRRVWTRSGLALGIGALVGLGLSVLLPPSLLFMGAAGLTGAAGIILAGTVRTSLTSRPLHRVLERAAIEGRPAAAVAHPALRACPACGRWTPSGTCTAHPDTPAEALYGPEATVAWRDAVVRSAREMHNVGTTAPGVMLMVWQAIWMAGMMAVAPVPFGTAMGLAIAAFSLGVAVQTTLGTRRRLRALVEAPDIPPTLHRSLDEAGRRVWRLALGGGLVGAAIAGTALWVYQGLDQSGAALAVALAVPALGMLHMGWWWNGSPDRALRRAGIHL